MNSEALTLGLCIGAILVFFALVAAWYLARRAGKHL